MVPGEQMFFHENERNDQERSQKKKRIESGFKNIETICKVTERNGNCLKRMFKIRNPFLLSRMRSKSGTHFKSGMCSKSSRNN